MSETRKYQKTNLTNVANSDIMDTKFCNCDPTSIFYSWHCTAKLLPKVYTALQQH